MSQKNKLYYHLNHVTSTKYVYNVLMKNHVPIIIINKLSIYLSNSSLILFQFYFNFISILFSYKSSHINPGKNFTFKSEFSFEKKRIFLIIKNINFFFLFFFLSDGFIIIIF